MPLLTLIRHANAGPPPAEGGDFARELDERGRAEIARVAARLARDGRVPDAIVTSAAPRALLTAATLAAVLGVPAAQLRASSGLYLASREALLAEVRGLDPAIEHALIVGHNPGISELSVWLCGMPGGGLPTAAAVCFELDAASWADVERGCGTLLGDHRP